jgi:hypothetical protein
MMDKVQDRLILSGFHCAHKLQFLAALLRRRDAARNKAAVTSLKHAGTVTDEVGLVFSNSLSVTWTSSAVSCAMIISEVY